jgi:hypothetical protein
VLLALDELREKLLECLRDLIANKKGRVDSMKIVLYIAERGVPFETRTLREAKEFVQRENQEI